MAAHSNRKEFRKSLSFLGFPRFEEWSAECGNVNKIYTNLILRVSIQSSRDVRPPQKERMQFTSLLTEADFRDLQRLTRSKVLWFEPGAVAAECALATFGMWNCARVYLHRTPPIWPADVTIGLFVATSLALLFYRNGRNRKEKLEYLNATRPRRISLTPEGVDYDGLSGADAHVAWMKFASWREGLRVMILERTAGGILILPVSDLPEVERGMLRHLLQSNIGGSSKQPNYGPISENPSASWNRKFVLQRLSWFFVAMWAIGMLLQLPFLYFFHPKWATVRFIYGAEIFWWLCFLLSLVAIISAEDAWWGKVDPTGPKSLSEAIRESLKFDHRD